MKDEIEVNGELVPQICCSFCGTVIGYGKVNHLSGDVFCTECANED